MRAAGCLGGRISEEQDHIIGGKYGKTLDGKPPLVTGTYTSGNKFKIQVVLTAHHDGFFEFRLCKPDQTNPWAGKSKKIVALFRKH